MRRIFVTATVVLIMIAGVLAVLSAVFKPVEVHTAVVQIGPAQETVYATGHVEADQRRTLRAQRSAVIAEIYDSPATKRMFQEGDVVHKGDRILRLRDSALEARETAAAAALKRVTEQLKQNSPYRKAFEAQVQKAHDQATDARAREGRLKAQLKTGGLSRDAYDQAGTAADVAEQQLHQLEQQYAQALEDLQASKAQAKSELDTLNAQESDDILRAPIDGVLLTLPLDIGEFAPAGTEVAKVGDLRKMIIEAEVNEDDIGRVTVGCSVDVRLSGYDDTLVVGRVFDVLPDANRETKGFTVKVEFSNAQLVAVPKEPLKSYIEVENSARPMSGMTAELGIVVAKRDKAITFPRPALTLNNTVFVVDGSRVREVKVELGLVNFSTCEATSGLKQGDKVAISNVKNLSDGARVKPKE